jgi:hypothetical protein
MSPSTAKNPRPPRTPDFVLTLGELRAVSAFNVACVERVIGLFEEAHPTDARPRAALRTYSAGTRMLRSRTTTSSGRAWNSDAVATVLTCVGPVVIQVLLRFPGSATVAGKSLQRWANSTSVFEGTRSND